MVRWNHKKFDVKDFTIFMLDFFEETDRAAVVLGAAKLDNLLEKLLEDYLLDFSTKSEKKDFFSFNGPLGTFSSRIHMLYRLQIIARDCFDGLHLIRKIRNEFAHNISNSKLNKSPAKELVDELLKPITKSNMFKDFEKELFSEYEHYSASFRTVITILAYQLEYLSNNVKDFNSGDPFSYLNIFDN